MTTSFALESFEGRRLMSARVLVQLSQTGEPSKGGKD